MRQMFNWLKAIQRVRDKWRYAWMEGGVLCVTTGGTIEVPK